MSEIKIFRTEMSNEHTCVRKTIESEWDRKKMKEIVYAQARICKSIDCAVRAR